MFLCMDSRINRSDNPITRICRTAKTSSTVVEQGIELQLTGEVNPEPLSLCYVMADQLCWQRQTAVTAYLKSKQLLLFAFARQSYKYM